MDVALLAGNSLDGHADVNPAVACKNLDYLLPYFIPIIIPQENIEKRSIAGTIMSVISNPSACCLD
jgi:hypothetical protein